MYLITMRIEKSVSSFQSSKLISQDTPKSLPHNAIIHIPVLQQHSNIEIDVFYKAVDIPEFSDTLEF